MNTKIKNIITGIANTSEINERHEKIDQLVELSNQAVRHGFIDIPMLKNGGIVADNHNIKVWFSPVSGMVSLQDVITIKVTFGADDLTISPMSANDISIELIYNL